MAGVSKTGSGSYPANIQNGAAKPAMTTAKLASIIDNLVKEGFRSDETAVAAAGCKAYQACGSAEHGAAQLASFVARHSDA